MFATYLPSFATAVQAQSATDFYSGTVYGWVGLDIKANMDACFPDDQKLADKVAEQMEMIKKGASLQEQWPTVEAETKLFNEDIKDCKDDADVVAAMKVMEDINTKFFAQKDWKDVLERNIKDNEYLMEAYGEMMTKAWDQGKYYESGKIAGLIDILLYKM